MGSINDVVGAVWFADRDELCAIGRRCNPHPGDERRIIGFGPGGARIGGGINLVAIRRSGQLGAVRSRRHAIRVRNGAVVFVQDWANA